MASISSTSSASSTNSLGNTSLRGFGGMVSGIDRDSIIEQMTLGTTTKINKLKTQMTELEWKQEAYRSISDKILGLTDSYTSFSSSKTLVDPNLFARNIINVNGLDSATKFVKASGSSAVTDSLSIKAVKQLASAAMQQSKGYGGSLVSGLDASKLTEEAVSARESALQNTWLRFKIDGIDDEATILFENTYTKEVEVPKLDAEGNEVKDEDGNTVYEKEVKEYTIDYNLTSDGATLENLADQLNDMLRMYEFNDVDENKNPVTKNLGDMIKFVATDDGKLTIEEQSGYEGKIGINAGSEALGVLFGENKPEGTDGYISVGDFQNEITANGVKYVDGNLDEGKGILKRSSGFSVLTGATATFSYNGDVKNIMLLTEDEAAALKDKHGDPNSATFDEEGAMKDMAEFIQGRIDRVYGEGNIKVNYESGKALEFETVKDNSFLAMTANDKVREVLGIKSGTSSRINVDETLTQNNLKLSDTNKGIYDRLDAGEELSMVINGTTISGITKDTTIDEILTKINESDAGVKASYIESTGQFVLAADKTGAGRDIKLESVKKEDGSDDYNLAEALFGGEGSQSLSGQDAEIVVNYGNGVDVTLSRSSNTFNLEGLEVTVSGIFGGDWVDKSTNVQGNFASTGKPTLDDNGDLIDDDGKRVDASGNIIKQYWVSDASETVTFEAKADVDKATERVKSFFEDYNALVSEVYKELTTRKDRSYGALTDEQKAEMTEDEIEKWEAKAKQGLLYNDSNMEALNSDLEGMLTKWMNSGISYADLEKIGITYVSDWSGGASTINFDEEKFRAAMENNPELVSDIFTGSESGGTSIIKTLDNTLTTYATRYANRNGGSYGRLIEEAGSEQLPTTEMKNYIYNQLKEMNERLESLQAMLKTKQERYIKQFTSMETLINQYNSQSGYLSQIMA